MGIEEEVDPVARVKPGNVGALDVGSSIGCGVGRLLGRGGSGAWFRTGGVEGAGAAAQEGLQNKPARSLAPSSSMSWGGAAGRGSIETGQATGGSATVAKGSGWASAARGVVELEVGATTGVVAACPAAGPKAPGAAGRPPAPPSAGSFNPRRSTPMSASSWLAIWTLRSCMWRSSWRICS